MKKVQLSNRSLLELPPELILDILCRLPIKTCLSCKLVCKDWYDIITSPWFADLRGSRCSPRVTLMLKCRFPNGRLNFLMLELDKESSNVDQMGTISVGADHMIKFKSKFGIPNGKLFVVNACNGLACLKSDKRWDCYYICNFLTSQFLTVKQFRPRFHSLYKYVLGSCPMDTTTTTQVRLCRGSEYPYICGLTPARGEVYPENHSKGSHLMTHQYKLLRILKTGIQYVAEILTLGSDEWRRIDNAPKSFYNFQAFLNGSFHWYDNKGGECNIWAFHFGIEKFFRIPTPDEFKVRPYAALTVFDSYLCFCCTNGNGFASTESEVWLMKEYGVGHSWVKQFIIDAPKPIWYHPYKPLMRVANGLVLINRCDSCLALYDPETRAYKDVKFDGSFNIGRLQACDADFSRLLGGVQRD